MQMHKVSDDISCFVAHTDAYVIMNNFVAHTDAYVIMNNFVAHMHMLS